RRVSDILAVHAARRLAVERTEQRAETLARLRRGIDEHDRANARNKSGGGGAGGRSRQARRKRTAEPAVVQADTNDGPDSGAREPRIGRGMLGLGGSRSGNGKRRDG